MMMRQAFLDAFYEVLGPEPGIGVIHSSIADLAPPAEFRKSDVLDALDQLIADGWTIALPAFTLSFCQGRPFRASRSPSEVGQLADWLLVSRGDARRTPHPMYSFAVAGPAAGRIAACRSTTTFGDDSPFALFERENATLVMLGCGWKYCTQYHRYEEEAKVPQRLFKEFVGRADLGDGLGEREVRATMFVRDLELNPVNDFTRAEARLRDEGLIATRPLLHAQIEAIRLVDFARVCRELLNDDPLTFVHNRSEVAAALAKRSRTGEPPPSRITAPEQSEVSPRVSEVATVDGQSPTASLVRQLLKLPANADLSEAALGVTPGWDSLKQIEILVSLESEFDIRFLSSEMESLHRFTDLDSLCRTKLAERASR
jgi:aminoglycoside N3'-acetyltransferase/acyl carrier protein